MKTIKQKMFRPRATWEKNLIVLWFSVFMAGMAFSEIMPFMSLYVDTLGTFTKSELNFYSGLVFAVTYLVTAIVSPLWGKLADRHGRKIMILRASAGMAIVLALMGLVTNVWQLMALRFIQGIFSGYISNANALIATETPKEKSGRALGTLMAGTTGGNLLGPLLGGTLASIFSYRITFFITGGLLGIVFVMSLLFVHETDFKPAKSKDLFSTRGVLKGY